MFCVYVSVCVCVPADVDLVGSTTPGVSVFFSFSMIVACKGGCHGCLTDYLSVCLDRHEGDKIGVPDKGASLSMYARARETPGGDGRGCVSWDTQSVFLDR